ncbi:MAG TPA: amino acid racemase [Chitinophagaceae bacterium]|nr:amino acid racemase [Chitinophagaceae bacterium]
MKATTFSNKTAVSRREAVGLVASAGVLGLIGVSPWLNQASAAVSKTYNMKHSITGNIPAMKTIGILGGLGPQATTDLEMRIHQVAQRMIPAAQNSGYPTMLVHYYRHPPILLNGQHMPIIPFQPDPRLLETARQLGSIVDFLIIPSNGVHMLQKDIEQASGRKVLSMIEATIAAVKERGWKRVGVLGLMNANVYSIPLKHAGIACETIDEQLQVKLNQSIFRVMEGRDGESDRAIALEAIQQLRGKQVEGIIPGCTELPFLLREHMNAGNILNPVQLLAEAAVRYSLA